jgi:uncharacterized protein involved in exopolysaccharide biosynthesis
LTNLKLIERPVVKVAQGVLFWKKQALWAFSISFALVLLAAVLLPNRYTSHLKILVKNERANSLISVSDQTQGVLYLNDVSEAQINTEIELLNSSDLLRQVVVRCHLADLVSASVKDPDKREAIALHDLQNALTVSPAHRSDVIEVTYQSPDPRRSAQVLQTLSQVYQASHLELHGAPGSYAFFDKLLNDTTAQLESANRQLAAFKQSRQIVSLPEQKIILLQHVTDLQKQAEASSADAVKSKQEALAFESSLAQMPASIEKERRSIPNQQTTEQLSSMLVTLKNKRAEASTRYQPGDRIVQDLDAQIKITQDALDQARNAPAQEIASDANPNLLSAQGDLVRYKADYAGGVAQAGTLEEETRRNQARLAQLESATVSYEDLERQVTELTALRETYRKKRDEANIDQQLDQQNLSNVAIVEQPVVEAIAASPRRGVIVALGFIWSIMVAVFVALVMDFWHRPIQSPVELENARQLKMLASLPRQADSPWLAGPFKDLYSAMQRNSTSHRVTP